MVGDRILAALAERQRTGKGGIVGTSLLETGQPG
jgi:crotonobetainyl-CoA:carnitine CoA-transferase CaiB-like acyl-CoA transferase